MPFPQVPRQVIVVLFYAVPLLLLLVMNLQKPPKVDYAVFDEFYIQSDAKIKGYNDEIITYFIKNIKKAGSHTEGLKYSKQIDSIVTKAYNKVGQLKQRLTDKAGLKPSDSWFSSQNSNSKRSLQKSFINNHSPDTLQKLIDSIIEQLMVFISRYDTPTFRKLVNYQWFSKSIEDFRNTDYTFDEHWCSKIFEHENLDGIVALLSLIQNNLLVTEHLFLIRIFEVYHIREEGFDHHGVVVIPGKDLILKNSRAKAYALYADYAWGNSNLSFQTSEGRIDNNINFVGSLSITAKGLGLHTVYGNDTLNTDDSTKIYPWSFSYFVAAPGAALELDSMQILYRGIANPILISVPGYPLNKITLRVPGAKVSKLANGHYEISIMNKTQNKLTAYTDATNNKGITATVNITELKVKDLPPPVCLLNGMNNDTISMDEFKKHAGLRIQAGDNDFEVNYDLVKFSVSLRKINNQFLWTAECTNSILANNEVLVELLKQAGSGDRVYVNDIVVTGGGRKNIEAMPVSVVLK